MDNKKQMRRVRSLDMRGAVSWKKHPLLLMWYAPQLRGCPWGKPRLEAARELWNREWLVATAVYLQMVAERCADLADLLEQEDEHNGRIGRPWYMIGDKGPLSWAQELGKAASSVVSLWSEVRPPEEEESLEALLKRSSRGDTAQALAQAHQILSDMRGRLRKWSYWLLAVGHKF